MNSAAENIVKLAALASVIDGKATDEEKNFIVIEGSHLLKTSEDEIRNFMDLWIGIYQSKGAANNPGIALNLALEVLKPLKSSQKHLAFHICEEVIHIDKKVTESELPFIMALQRLVFS
ncbi:MAG: hypothetical protein F6K48_12065 [Okeania sp. SIO3H1]|uniref:hypothetical protein n=1 Tax=Okeania sp. SIO1I7 TaxID=2607772 RepID=UPI0013CD3C7E|nr:hypothetical protein [Okeania sp. SIO1I7]NEN89595.1 hypothetical protein [Okeania sp. SIO3H1]NET28818.1 hypothetical protein [Okeania sp. SIO1I7]